MGEQKKKSKIIEFLDSIPARSCGLWTLAGAYVLYLGYKLCKGVLDGADGSGPGFMVAGIAFIVVGGFMLFGGIRGLAHNRKLKEEAAAADELPEETAEAPGEIEEAVAADLPEKEAETILEEAKKPEEPAETSPAEEAEKE